MLNDVMAISLLGMNKFHVLIGKINEDTAYGFSAGPTKPGSRCYGA